MARKRASFWLALTLYAAAGLLFVRALMIFANRPAPPEAAPAAYPIRSDAPWREPPTPPATERLFPIQREGAFQALYESGLPVDEVVSFYKKWGYDNGWQVETPGAADGGLADEDAAAATWWFRRDGDTLLLTVFAGEKGCDFRLAALRGGRAAAPSGEVREAGEANR